MKTKKEYDLDDIVRAFAIGIAIMMVASKCQAQTVLLPSWVADSLIYETKLSRQCSEVMKAQASEIESLGRELVANGKALQLSQSSNETLSALVENAKENNQLLTRQFSKDLREEKRKTRKWRTVSLLECIGLIGLLLLL